MEFNNFTCSLDHNSNLYHQNIMENVKHFSCNNELYEAGVLCTFAGS